MAAREVDVRVVKDRDDGIVRRVRLLDNAGGEVQPVTRFLSHLTDKGYSPNTVCAYGYDLRHLMSFLENQGIGWTEFRASTALEFLGYLRRVPSMRPGATVRVDRGDEGRSAVVAGDGATGARRDVELL